MNKREKIKKICYETNNVGARLEWVRCKLKLTLTEVSNTTGIPYSSLHDRETSYRTTYYEEILILTLYYNRIWVEKFREPPRYQDQKINSISFSWVCLGFDPEAEYNRALIEEIEHDYRNRENMYVEENLVLKNQLSLFQGD